MIPRIINFSDLSSEVTENGEISTNSLTSSEDKNDSVDCPICSSEDEKEGDEAESNVNVQNGLDNGDVNSVNGEVRDEIIPFSLWSIQVAASTIGISNLDPAVSQLIAGELFYKVKELLFMSRMILHKNKQTVLTRGDIRKSISMLGGANIYGHVFSQGERFVRVPCTTVFVEEDVEVDTVGPSLSESVYSQKGEPYIQGQWLLPDGYPEKSASSSEPNSYYSKLSKAILSGKPSHLQLVLKDLQSNPKIGPYCPFLLNLVALTVKKVNRGIPLTNALIATAHAIAHNRFVEPSPYLAVNRAANSLLKIVIEVGIHKNYDDLSVRVRAGLLLAKVVEIWTIELRQQIDIIRYLLQHLLDSTLPLQSHYGAIVTLAALGQRTLDFYVWPVMERYLEVLEVLGKQQDFNKHTVMVQFVIGAILAALRITRKKGLQSAEQTEKLSKMENALYQSFGDSITPVRLATFDSPPVVPRAKAHREPYQLKLRVQRTPLAEPGRSRCDLAHMFDLPAQRLHRDPSKLPKAHYFDSSSVRWKPFSYCVTRNIKFVKPRHLTSAAGDLLINL